MLSAIKGSLAEQAARQMRLAEQAARQMRLAEQATRQMQRVAQLRTIVWLGFFGLVLRASWKANNERGAIPETATRNNPVTAKPTRRSGNESRRDGQIPHGASIRALCVDE